MARKLTDKLQISGYRLLVQRIEQGFISRDVRGFVTPFSRQAQAFGIGMGLAALVLVAALAMSLFKPSSNGSQDDKIVATKSGSRFVIYEDTLHPVTNLSSARLIAGSNSNVKVIKDEALNEYPRGQLMGIAAAPDDMSARTDEQSQWAVCSQYDADTELDLTNTSTPARTLIAAGDDAITSTDFINDDTAILVSESSSADSRFWLLYKGQRIEIPTTAYALRSTLRITENTLSQAPVITDALLDAVPSREPFAKPGIRDEGKVSTVLPRFRIGSVVSAPSVDGNDSSWLVLDDTVQKISPFVAQMFVNSGSTITKDVTSAEIAAAPEKSTFDFSAYPQIAPEILTTADTICYDWTRLGDGPAAGRFVASSTVPLSSERRRDVTALLPPTDGTTQAEFFYTRPGKGWLAVATGQTDQSHTASQLWWVADNGVRYPIGGSDDTPIDKVLAMLGVDTVTPVRAPWSILRLLPEGNSLAPESAKVLHATIPPEMAQSPAPAVKELN